MERNCSLHISLDRSDRLTYILLNVGLGTRFIKEEYTVDEKGRGSWQCLTDTGVLVVYDATKTYAITAYVATQPKVSAMYKGNTPSWVFKMVRKNKVHAEMQNKVKY